MRTSPPRGIASRALTTRFMITCSSWRSSTRTGARSGPCSIFSVTLSVSSRFSRCASSESVSWRLMTVGRSVCLREKASSWRTRAAARLAFWRICIRSPCSWSATSWRISSRSQWPLIAVSRLLKSWATPPASWPTACIFWRLDELRLEGLELGGVGEDREQRRRAVEHGAGEGDLQEHLLAVGGAAGDLGAAEGAALDRVGEALGDRAAEALDQVGEADAGRGALAEQLAGGGVGVGQPAVGLEAGERHRQLVEEVVGHEAGDLGAVERHEQQVAAGRRRRAAPPRARRGRSRPARARRRAAAAGRRACRGPGGPPARAAAAAFELERRGRRRRGGARGRRPRAARPRAAAPRPARCARAGCGGRGG